MNRTQRIRVEILSPSVLAAAIFNFSGGGDTLVDRITLFLIFLISAYWFGFVPSIIYAVVMELWFSNRFHAHKHGLVTTTAVSSALGLGAAFFIEWLIGEPDMQALLPVGTLAGSVIGFYLARRCRAELAHG